jgi:hypothetical protein
LIPIPATTPWLGSKACPVTGIVVCAMERGGWEIAAATAKIVIVQRRNLLPMVVSRSACDAGTLPFPRN